MNEYLSAILFTAAICLPFVIKELVDTFKYNREAKKRRQAYGLR